MTYYRGPEGGLYPLAPTATAQNGVKVWGGRLCNGCGGSGIHIDAQAAVRDGRLRRRNANRCGACAGEGWWPKSAASAVGGTTK